MFINVYQCLSMFINVYQCLSMFISVYQCLSMFINVYQCLSMFITFIYLYRVSPIQGVVQDFLTIQRMS